MGRSLLRQVLLACSLFAVATAAIPLPRPASADAEAPEPNGASALGSIVTPAPRAAQVARGGGDPQLLDPADVPLRFRDADARVSIVPPAGWTIAPSTSLDRASDEQAYEVARFQVRLGDAALYAQPLPVTKGLLADARAVLSVALAREGSDLEDLDLGSVPPDGVEHLPGATALDSETSYEAVTTFTRILVARETGRTAVIRAYVPSSERDALAPAILAAIASATLDPDGPAGPRYVAPAPPAPPAPEPAAESAAAPVDPTVEIRAEIVARAGAMLGTPYVWGGNSAGRGMDCSAYVSAAWDVSRYTTDSIWNVAVPVAKADLLPGDAMDLETWRDPNGYGHIRLFEAWANEAHTLVWVYEETPPRAVHRVIAYDAGYRPMRLAGLSGAGVAPLVPAPAAAPAPVFRPSAGWTRPAATRAPWPTRRPAATRAPWPTRRPSTATPRPTARRTFAPRSTPPPSVRPSSTPRPTARLTTTRTATPRPTATAHAAITPPHAPRPTARPTAYPTVRPSRRVRATPPPIRRPDHDD